LCRDTGVWAKARCFHHLEKSIIVFPGRDCLQREYLAPLLWPHGNAITDRAPQYLLHGVLIRIIQIQVTVFFITLEDALAPWRVHGQDQQPRRTSTTSSPTFRSWRSDWKANATGPNWSGVATSPRKMVVNGRWGYPPWKTNWCSWPVPIKEQNRKLVRHYN
jgi:hypothetical protein